MEVSARYTFDAPRQRVWDLLVDPEVIASCLPGCESMELVGEDTYRATLTIGVAAVTGRYQGTVRMSDKDEPSGYTLLVEGKGRPGFVNGSASVTLADGDADGRTRVAVTGKAQVGGTIARVGQRLLGGVSKMMMDRFFSCLQQRARAAEGGGP
ncbi:MAG: carbon monoxide dehydrogenase subunit G [Gemmatimonadota bacterium]|nr:carbon monoxide dehydrogenase subunit G [Gemmatimonadota bacterium]